MTLIYCVPDIFSFWLYLQTHHKLKNIDFATYM